jgi:hypothetical protein
MNKVVTKALLTLEVGGETHITGLQNGLSILIFVSDVLKILNIHLA